MQFSPSCNCCGVSCELDSVSGSLVSAANTLTLFTGTESGDSYVDLTAVIYKQTGDTIRVAVNYLDANNYLFAEITIGNVATPTCGTIALYKRVSGIETNLFGVATTIPLPEINEDSSNSASTTMGVKLCYDSTEQVLRCTVTQTGTATRRVLAAGVIAISGANKAGFGTGGTLNADNVAFTGTWNKQIAECDLCKECVIRAGGAESTGAAATAYLACETTTHAGSFSVVGSGAYVDQWVGSFIFARNILTYDIFHDASYGHYLDSSHDGTFGKGVSNQGTGSAFYGRLVAGYDRSSNDYAWAEVYLNRSSGTSVTIGEYKGGSNTTLASASMQTGNDARIILQVETDGTIKADFESVRSAINYTQSLSSTHTITMGDYAGIEDPSGQGTTFQQPQFEVVNGAYFDTCNAL